MFKLLHLEIREISNECTLALFDIIYPSVGFMVSSEVMLHSGLFAEPLGGIAKGGTTSETSGMINLSIFFSFNSIEVPFSIQSFHYFKSIIRLILFANFLAPSACGYHFPLIFKSKKTQNNYFSIKEN